MTDPKIAGLTLHIDGRIGIRGTIVPLKAEFPAVQLGGWTLSKALGVDAPLTASRGDGRILRFEYRDGRWQESESDAARGPSGKGRRSPSQDDEAAVEQLAKLASIPLDSFHANAICMEIRGPSDRSVPTYREGDYQLRADGSVVLGSMLHPSGSTFAGYRFGQSIAYRDSREDGSSLLVVASPASVRWFMAVPTVYTDCKFEELREYYDGLRHSVYEATPYAWAVWLAMLPIRLATLPFRLWFLGPAYWMMRAPVHFKDRFRFRTRKRRVLYEIEDMVFVRDDGTLYARLAPEDRAAFKARDTTSQIVLINSSDMFGICDTNAHGAFVEFPPGQRVLYTGRLPFAEGYFHVRSEDHYIVVTVEGGLEVSSYYPKKGLGGDARHLLKVAGGTVTHASLDSWDWYELHPRHGTANLPELEGGSTKRLGR